MGTMIELKADDGHHLSAYEAKPAGKPRGGLVIIQEIFGVNAHIKAVADGYAADGYHAIAPALFDRHEKGYERGYSPDDIQSGIAMMQHMKPEHMLADMKAAIKAVSVSGKVGIVGYCLGGSLAYLAASALPGVTATVGYYGGQIVNNLDKKPKVPVMLHFGEKDHSISMSDIEKVRKGVDPKMVQVFVYPGAQHGFNCDHRSSYDTISAKTARERSLSFLRANIG